MTGKSSEAAPGGAASRLLDLLSQGLAVLGAAALALIVFAYSFEVAARYLFNAPTEWAHDLVRYLLAAVVFLVAPDVARQRGHVAISFLVDRLTGGPHSWALRVLAAVSALAAGAAAAVVASEALRQLERGIATIAVHPIPKWWITAVIALGLALTALQFLRHALARASGSAD